MSAFTLLLSSLGKASERTRHLLADVDAAIGGHVSAEDQKLLAHVFPTGDEIEMPFHLLRLLRENESLMRQIIGVDFGDFVAAVCNTLVFVERRVSEAGRQVLGGSDLYYAIQKIRMLIKIIILRELGFDDSRVTALIWRNNEFAALRIVRT
jgi:hypothetical protein